MSSYPPDEEIHTSTPIYEEIATPSTTYETQFEPATEIAEPHGAVAGQQGDQLTTGQPATGQQATGEQGDQQGKVGAAKDEAGAVASDAKDAAGHVAGVTKDQAKQVASEAKDQAKELFTQTTSQLKEQAGVQQKRVAEGLRAASDQLGSMADGSESGLASQVVRNLGDRAGSVAGWLDDREPGELLSEMKSFAARRPALFIGIAAGAGILAGRLAKSLAAAASDDAATSTGTGGSTGGSGL